MKNEFPWGNKSLLVGFYAGTGGNKGRGENKFGSWFDIGAIIREITFPTKITFIMTTTKSNLFKMGYEESISTYVFQLLSEQSSKNFIVPKACPVNSSKQNWNEHLLFLLSNWTNLSLFFISVPVLIIIRFTV
jgi:hypothetical protein